MCAEGGCLCASIPVEQERRLKAGLVKQAFVTDGADDREARASHHLMNEDGVVVLHRQLLEQKIHPEAVASCC